MSKLIIKTPITNEAETITLNLPDKNEGIYTIATTADIEALPEPMLFKGGATITESFGTYIIIVTTPSTASDIKEGYTYKITNAPADDTNFKVGDTIIANKDNPGTNPQSYWTLIPSGDEPSGTVTSIGLSMPTGFTVTGSPVTTSGTLTATLDSGYELLNSNTSQTIAGNKIFTGATTFDLGGRGTIFNATNNNSQSLSMILDSGGGNGSNITYDDESRNHHELLFPKKSGTFALTNDLANDIADEYDGRIAYVIGDKIAYQGQVYRCNTNTTVANQATAITGDDYPTWSTSEQSQYDWSATATIQLLGSIVEVTNISYQWDPASGADNLANVVITFNPSDNKLYISCDYRSQDSQGAFGTLTITYTVKALGPEGNFVPAHWTLTKVFNEAKLFKHLITVSDGSTGIKFSFMSNSSTLITTEAALEAENDKFYLATGLCDEGANSKYLCLVGPCSDSDSDLQYLDTTTHSWVYLQGITSITDIVTRIF